MYINWLSGQPNRDGSLDCAVMAIGKGGKWTNENCGKAYHSACSRPLGEHLLPLETYEDYRKCICNISFSSHRKDNRLPMDIILQELTLVQELFHQ